MSDQFWKLLTSDLRPPIQGGGPLFDGQLPYLLPEVDVNSTDAECGRGWNFVRNIETGFSIAGMWRTRRPNAVLLVEPSDGWVERGNKCRAAQLNLVRHATDEEIKSGLLAFSKSFGAHHNQMAEEQWQWWTALKRPCRDRDKVITGLQLALKRRGLDWFLKEYPAARDAWNYRDSWNARDALNAMDSRDAWNAMDAWYTWHSSAYNDHWAARDVWDSCADSVTWDASAALTVSFAARSGWIKKDSDFLTAGIRDAYFNGLDIAVPTGTKELGWSMCE
jgi:hypothetical protein